MRSWMGYALFLGVGAKEVYCGTKRKIDNFKLDQIKEYNNRIEELCKENAQKYKDVITSPRLEKETLEELMKHGEFEARLIKELKERDFDVDKIGYDRTTTLMRYMMAKYGKVLSDDIDGGWKIFAEGADRYRKDKERFAGYVSWILTRGNKKLHIYFVEFENGYCGSNGALINGYEGIRKGWTPNRVGAGHVMFLYGDDSNSIHKKLLDEKKALEDQAGATFWGDVATLIGIGLFIFFFFKLMGFIKALVG